MDLGMTHVQAAYDDTQGGVPPKARRHQDLTDAVLQSSKISGRAEESHRWLCWHPREGGHSFSLQGGLTGLPALAVVMICLVSELRRHRVTLTRCSAIEIVVLLDS